VILSRGYVMTRGGIDALREQLYAEASRHGLGQAAHVLVVADGAVWIWNLVTDRFPQARQRLEREINYFENNNQRLGYAEGKQRGEPVGSGAMESTCRQYQCRFKRPGQFWTQTGDEALMCLETFWRNDRWNLLFPHIGIFTPSRN
jgi:hypothetical protein